MLNRKVLLCVLLTSVLALPLVACSSNDKKDELEAAPVEELYGKADAAMKEENYKEATKFFEEVERQHPYSQWSTRAQMMGAYASYLDERYDDAIAALSRYIELHPGAQDVDYAYYLKAMCFYEQITDVARDQQMTKNALEALEVVIRRFPDSQYAREAVLKRDLTLDHLAGKEMEIGRYYLHRGEVNAAINRFRAVIAQYQTTTHTAEALHRLVESYVTLGLREEAVQVAAVLGHNYPGSSWYERSYALLDPDQQQRLKDDRGFWDKTLDSLLKPD